MMLQTGKQIFIIQILPNISGHKISQTMIRYGQLIEYFKMRNTFLEKSYTKCGGKTGPRAFFKNSKLEHFSESTS